MAVQLKDLDCSTYDDFDAHQRIVEVTDAASGLHALIGVHNTNLGPALGGLRVYPYASQEDAIRDVLRLSRGMTYKSALAGLPLGGGKSVMMLEKGQTKTPEMMAAFGEALEKLGGIYITAEDVGSSEPDMEIIAKQTSYVTGLPESDAYPLSGNPSPHTAYGVYVAMKSVLEPVFGQTTPAGLTVTIKGLGAVGFALARYLHADGADLKIADIAEGSLQRGREAFPTCEIVSVDEAHAAPCDIFAPCALGGGLNPDTIPQINAKLVCGAANNQLARADRDGTALQNRGIFYAPDYVVNAAGVIAVAYAYFERAGVNPFAHDLSVETLRLHIEGLGQRMRTIHDEATEYRRPPHQVADLQAEKLFRKK
ncbi:MAG: Glu/Leu/Phe/Val dehydrogenase [Pseudobdellovibrionaceae bacterium]